MTDKSIEKLKKEMNEDYKLIPMSEITDEARLLAVAWVEGYEYQGMDIPGKQKLASDIMNYARRQNKAELERERELQAEIEKWKDEYGAMEKIIADYQITDKLLKNKLAAATELIFPYWKKEHEGIPSFRIQDEWELFKSENNL